MISVPAASEARSTMSLSNHTASALCVVIAGIGHTTPTCDPSAPCNTGTKLERERHCSW